MHKHKAHQATTNVHIGHVLLSDVSQLARSCKLGWCAGGSSSVSCVVIAGSCTSTSTSTSTGSSSPSSY